MSDTQKFLRLAEGRPGDAGLDFIRCELCGKEFDPHNQPYEIVNGKWICCAHNYSPEEMAEEMGISVNQSYDDMGLYRPGEEPHRKTLESIPDKSDDKHTYTSGYNVPDVLVAYGKKKGLELIGTGGSFDYLYRVLPDGRELVLGGVEDPTNQPEFDGEASVGIFTDESWSDGDTKNFPTAKEAMDFMATFGLQESAPLQRPEANARMAKKDPQTEEDLVNTIQLYSEKLRMDGAKLISAASTLEDLMAIHNSLKEKYEKAANFRR